MVMDLLVRILQTAIDSSIEMGSELSSESSSECEEKINELKSSSFLNVEVDLDKYIDHKEIDHEEVDIKSLLDNIKNHNKLNERIIRIVYNKYHWRVDADPELKGYIRLLTIQCRRNTNVSLRQVGKNFQPFSKNIVEWLDSCQNFQNQNGSAEVKSAAVDEISISV